MSMTRDMRTERASTTTGATGRKAARVVTTTQATRRIYLAMLVACGLMVGTTAISKATWAWIVVLVEWIVVWGGFYVIWGRYWHPIRQFRYEWRGYRQGNFKRSWTSEAAYAKEVKETGGHPPDAPAPPETPFSPDEPR